MLLMLYESLDLPGLMIGYLCVVRINSIGLQWLCRHPAYVAWTGKGPGINLLEEELLKEDITMILTDFFAKMRTGCAM